MLPARINGLKRNTAFRILLFQALGKGLKTPTATSLNMMNHNAEKSKDFPRLSYVKNDDPFFRELKQNVNKYFETNRISPYANRSMYLKSVVLVSMWIGFYTLMLSNILHGTLLMLSQIGFHFTMFLMAVGIAHDGSHNAYSKRPEVNKIMNKLFDFIGINSYMWDFNHIKSHHQAPNVPLYDSAIHSFKLFRFHPLADRFDFHKFQHIYIFVIYACSTLFKLFFLDFFSFFRNRIGFIRMNKHSMEPIFWLIASKSFVFAYTLLIPLMIIDAPAWQIMAGFVLGHMVSGIALGIIFQVTHLSDHTTWPSPDKEGLINNTFARHILETTADFCPQNRLVTWISGGLNIHVAHHLFPRVSQIHLPALAKIVKQTANNHRVYYKEYTSLLSAIKSHLRTLKFLGQPDQRTILQAATFPVLKPVVSDVYMNY